MSVTVLERSSRLLRNSLDAVASEMLRSYFEALGITIVTDAETARVEGDGRVEAVVTAQGHRFETEILLVAAGVNPNLELPRQCGLDVARGVIVDSSMRSSDPSIFAVGDLAEFEGRLWGLWPVAVSQAQIAATNIAGGSRTYESGVPTMILKGVGLDVVSFGRVEPAEDETQFADRGEGGHTYRKVVVAG
ncbi:MAG: hypothetical protein JWN39_432, partial [Ilumatobacteraceae bacterium]|nr:hypothetical protein [Ilumatobacteraceae bacterium]